MTDKPDQMYQCRLAMVRIPQFQQTAWIPAHGAQVGKKVELLPSGEFWEVVAVYRDTPMDVFQLKERERINRKGLPSTRDTKKDKART